MGSKRAARARTIRRLRELYRETGDPNFSVAADCLQRAEDAKVGSIVDFSFSAGAFAFLAFFPPEEALRGVMAVLAASVLMIAIRELFEVRANLDTADRCITEAESRYRP